MSRKANPKWIGIFVTGAAALAVAAVLLFGSADLFSEKVVFVCYFQGSVKGLAVGAPVSFRGVRVGTVSAIKLRFEGDDWNIRIPVTIELNEGSMAEPAGVPDDEKDMDYSAEETVKELIKRGLRAQLQLQSLVTGQLFVQLDFYPSKDLRLVGVKGEHPEMPTVPSSLEELSRTLERLPLDDLANRLLKAVEGIEKLVNSPELAQGLSSLNETLKTVQSLVVHLDEQVGAAGKELTATLKYTRELVASLKEGVPALISSAQSTIRTGGSVLQEMNRSAKDLTSHVDAVGREARSTLEEARRTLASIGSLAAEGSPLRYELNKALKELSSAARSIRVMADYLERHPEALVHGKGR